MKEWNDKYNSFNSFKSAFYFPNYQSIKDWKDGKLKAPLPPIEISLDPINVCQLRCAHCNASRYLLDPPKDRMIRMTDEHYMNLVKFLAEWGVKAICHGGGGEPTLHTKLGEALRLAKFLGLENSIATNGINFNEKLIDIATETCRWIGVSVDSATAKTYEIGRGKNCFDKTINNISLLSKKAKEKNTNCDISFKFLVFEYNQYEIYEACKLAKEIGARDFHARPADLSHQGMSNDYKGKSKSYDVEYIKEQFVKCHELENKDFRVFTAIHKFDENFVPLKRFHQCYASSCCLQICPNGECYICPDQRYSPFFKLGNHYPNPKEILEFWGGKKHYDLVFNSGFKACSTRCTFTPYNEDCERLFINNDDPMCWKFI